MGKTAWHFVGFGVVALGLVTLGCGGSGSSSQFLTPAPDPTCTASAISALSSKTDNMVELQKAGAIVPSTTVAYATDAGVRAHTNHLIAMGNATSRLSGPTGLTPDLVRTAYGVPPNLGAGAIAIVDAYHYPTSVADFNTFSTQFGLPTEPSGSATASTNAVFQVVFAAGVQPATDTGWSQEMAIDTQWAHAMAPNAKIYLVEAKSASVADLMTAVNVAKALPGVKQVSMSFGATESACNFVKYDPNLVQSGVAFFAAAGDTSNEKDFPALSKNAVSVGGTTLITDGVGNRVSENAWNQTGGGISAFEPRPTFQNLVIGKTTTFRAGCDISAVGDPITGVSVYDSTASGGLSGWINFGGTSVACPIVAGIANAAGSHATSSTSFNTLLYSMIGTSGLYDVKHGTSGVNSADHGWDVVSGVGSPNGIAGL
ncbi:MAG: S53 family peptidase [Armatimonadota bacterium]